MDKTAAILFIVPGAGGGAFFNYSNRVIIIIINLQAPFHHNGLLYGNFWVLHMGMRRSV